MDPRRYDAADGALVAAVGRPLFKEGFLDPN